jgi:putative transposase
MENVRKGSHSIHQLHVHLVWSTKYRYEVLRGDVQIRCRELIRQSCDSLDIQILKGVVSNNHIHLHISYPPKMSISEILKRLKGRSAKILLMEYSELKKRYWGGHLWGIGYGAWSTGNITDEMIQHYLDHHKEGPNSDQNFILE